MLAETLDSLARQDLHEFEIVVVCDGEDSHTRALSESYRAKYPLTWVFLSENQGPPSARNRGASEAQGEILLFLDDDTPAAPDWLFQHAKHHDAHGKDFVVCGEVIETYAAPPRSNTDRFLRKDRERILSRKGISLSGWGMDFDLYVVCGLNCSIRRTSFEKSGGFDPALRQVHEDLELGSRLNSRSFRFLYEPLALVYHRSTKNLEREYGPARQFAGRADAFRLDTKNQRNAQMLPITHLHHGKALSRLKQRVAWHHSGSVARLANLCRTLTEVTGSEFFFRRWRNYISAARYWEGVRSTGLTVDDLGRLVGQPLPMLVFHSISVPCNPNETKYGLTPQRFGRFMHWLRSTRFQFVTPLEWLAGNAPARCVCLTFDDGYEDFYCEVFPMLERLHLKPTVFIVVDQIGKFNAWDEKHGFRRKKLLSHEQMREMHRYGVNFGTHTLTHPWLPDLSDSDLRREVVDSKSRLEDLLSSEVSCFAYPWGGIDARVRAAVAAAGYKAAMTMNPGLSFWQDSLCLSRIDVSERDTFLDFGLKVETGRSIVREAKEGFLRWAHDLVTQLPDPMARAMRRTARVLRVVPSRPPE